MVRVMRHPLEHLKGVRVPVPYDTTPSIGRPPRTCMNCPTILSRYNPDDLCAPCYRDMQVGLHIAGFGPCEWCGAARTTPRTRFCSVGCSQRYRNSQRKDRT